MNITFRHLMLGCAVWWFAFVTPLSLQAADRVLSVQDLNQMHPQLGGRIVIVEGRMLVLGKVQLRLRNCDLIFRADAGLPEISRRARNVEITGQIISDEAKPYFQVSSLRELPDDIDTFQQKRRQVTANSVADWFKLADWAKRRGMFYKDQELLSRGEESYLRGIAIERNRIPKNDSTGFFKLAEKVQRMELPETLYQSLVHEGYRVLWEASQQEKSIEALERLAAAMARDLPGATEPIVAEDTELRKAYKARPLPTYETADGKQRLEIHRLLYDDVVLRSITAKLAADASNGFEIADLIDRQLPERHSLAESYRNKTLAVRAAEVEKLPRREVLELAEQYRSRDQPRQAEQVLETWLTLRLRKLPVDDTEGMLQLADEYRTLLKRPDSALRLLLDAYKRNPASAEVKEQLERAGLHLRDGVWLTDEQFTARPEGKIDQAMREGRVEAGMTGTQVRKSLGEPQKMSRTASSGQITEVWIYAQADSTQLAVQLNKRRRQPELSVIGVTHLRTR